LETTTAVFALATPKSPIDLGGRWQLQFTYIAIFFYFSVILSDTHQGRVWNQTTQPELVAGLWCLYGLDHVSAYACFMLHLRLLL
jgi:hypothetical protein